MKRVVIGLSGGVDSSVAAALLIEQGYEVEGVYLECYNEPGCRTDQDKADALKVAIKLGIKFEVLDFRKEYSKRVIEYFYREYEAGRTPNPDIVCNREIKFGIFYDWALRLNSFAQGYNHEPFDYVATGHYCRTVLYKVSPCKVQGETLRFLRLQRGRDESKDQSYFLWQIPRDHLSHILFPLGNMLKSEVRAKAKELDLHVASKPDSMGICFIGEVDVSKLLKERLGEKPGNVVLYPAGSDLVGQHVSDLRDLTLNGAVVGRHRGLWFYTIGSRGGWERGKLNHYTIKTLHHLGIDTNDWPPLYVIGKDMKKNQLIVGSREETMTKQFTIYNLHPTRMYEGASQFTNKDQVVKYQTGEMYVRIRNLGELSEVKSLKIVNCKLEIETAKAVFGVASGQSAVIYDENGVLVTGGIIV